MVDYDRPHIDVTPLLTVRSYKAHKSTGARTFTRNREQHGAHLSAGLAASFEAAEARRPSSELLPPGVGSAEGAFVTVTLHPDAKELRIEKPDKGIRQSAAGEDDDRRTMVLHISDQDGRDYLTERVERYRAGPLTPMGQPSLAPGMQPIEGFSPTELGKRPGCLLCRRRRYGEIVSTRR